MELVDFSLKAGLALLGGFSIGIEREIRHKSAGLKTNSLVSLGACVFVLLSLEFQGNPAVDPTRVGRQNFCENYHFWKGNWQSWGGDPGKQ